MDYPRQLITAGAADGASLYQYAVGKLVLWVPPDSPLDVEHKEMQTLLDPSVKVDPEHPHPGKPGTIEGVVFENNPGIKESPALIDFIAASTGKMRALAAADLDSHLELTRQFLNIGKPFLFEGIGSLVKLQSGIFSFSPGPVITEKIKETTPKEITVAQSAEDSPTDYKSILYPKKIKRSPAKILALLLLLAGVALAIWGGYTVYKKTTAKNRENVPPVKNQEETQVVSAKDSGNHQLDSLSSLSNTMNTTLPAPGTYKFVIETSGKQRALYRYSLLKGYGLDVRMGTPDSVHYKLFFILPASVADTARMRDSLQIIYTPPWSKAFVED